MGKIKLTHGMKQLLSDDPCSPLIYAVEQVQGQAHHRRLGRVLRRLKRRKYELGWVHASEAGNPCARVIAAQLLGFELPREPIDPRLSRIFENGTYMHLRYYNYFLSLPAPFEPQVAVVLKRWPIIGEADVIVYHPEMGNQIIELKSINDHGFKILKKPQENHGNQVNVYLGLAPSTQKGNFIAGQVWYENKNNQDIKAYPHEFNSEPFEGTFERVEEIADAVIEGNLPNACGECKYDEYISNLRGVEKKMSQLREVRDKSRGQT